MSADTTWGIYKGDKCPLGGEGVVFAAWKNNQALFIREMGKNAYVGTIAVNAIPIQLSGSDLSKLGEQLEAATKEYAPAQSSIVRAHIANFTS